MRAAALILALALLAPARLAAAPDPNTCVGYPESRVFLESQGWWVKMGADQGNDFGHVHAGACFPLGQTVSGVVGFDLKLQLHSNPGALFHVLPFICNNANTTLCYRAPDVVFSPPLTCPSQCVFYQHVDVDTTRWPYDGANAIRFRTEVREPDGNVLRASNNWLVDIRNGNPVKEFDPGPGYIDAKGWFHGFYSIIKILGGYTPNPSAPFTLSFRCTSTGEPVDDCLVTVDPDFHAVPPSSGQVVLDNGVSTRQTVTVTPSLYPVGPHVLVLRSCIHDTRSVPGQDAHRCGVLRLPFVSTGAA